jgi:uncharacterized protein YdaU (DUF1376 family)
MATTQAEARYKKLKNGRWGLRVESSSAITPGTKALVSKRDGTSEVRTVDSVLWQGFSEDGKHLAICTQKRTKADEKYLAAKKAKASKAKKAEKAEKASAAPEVDVDAIVAAAVAQAVAAALAAQAPKKGKARKPKKSE